MTKNTEPVLDLDDLLAGEFEETPTQKRIRELKLELSVPAPVDEVEDIDKPLTAEELEVKDLEDQLARKLAAEYEAAPTKYDNTEKDGEDTILLHVLEDGFTAGGQVWYRGQEIEYAVGSRAYEQTLDRTGKSWLSMVADTPAQYSKWGKQMIAPGPWPGKAWGDVSGMSDLDEIKATEKAAEMERRRSRKAPLI